MPEEQDHTDLVAYLDRVPSVSHVANGTSDNGIWWIKFNIDISHPVAWNVVQEFGHVLNYLSVDERLSCVFMPVSPPPCMNGGPSEFLSWVIESHNIDFTPAKAAEWLEGRLPRPVEDESEGLWTSKRPVTAECPIKPTSFWHSPGATTSSFGHLEIDVRGQYLLMCAANM